MTAFVLAPTKVCTLVSEDIPTFTVIVVPPTAVIGKAVLYAGSLLGEDVTDSFLG